jgi:hypothetical protein
MRHAFQTGELPSKEKYTDIKYPLDMDMYGQVWHLKGNLEVFARSKPLNSKSEMQKKRRVAHCHKKQQDLQKKQDLLFVDAENVLKTNAECKT